MTTRRARISTEGPYLTREPLRAWLEAYLVRRSAWDPVTKRSPPPALRGPASMEEIAERLGTSSQRLREILTKEGGVTISVVDRLFTNAGEPYLLWELYEKELEASAAA